LMVTEGNIKIKLSQPKSSKYLYQQKDYENFEFMSPINPWNVQSQYKADFDKIKCLDISLTKGQIIYIPAYWWYSIEFGNETSVITFKYKTYMNAVAILPNLIMKFLQSQNVKRNNVKQLTMEKPSEQPIIETPILESEHIISPPVENSDNTTLITDLPIDNPSSTSLETTNIVEE